MNFYVVDRREQGMLKEGDEKAVRGSEEKNHDSAVMPSC
jgi:hypothetical protein